MRIVLTNGCFDLYHPGHAKLLKAAKNEGDYLIVAINTEWSVSWLKGNGRPYQSLKARMAQVAANPFVDSVIPFDGDVVSLVRAIHPDVLVKGGDYAKSQIVGAMIVESWGGKVVIVPRDDHYSTTNQAKAL